ncbi:hypothetical protein [Microbacterium sp.]|uniref:hypothetical protein n=1 Tax=Microbacterium sp. TaxID=51671 RepID=UPI003F6EEC39
MNADDKARFAAGETDEMPPAPDSSALSASDAVRKDMTYSPASETETQQKQTDPVPDSIDEDIDRDAIRTVPGTGGPDDTGDVDVDPEDLNLPGRGASSVE